MLTGMLTPAYRIHTSRLVIRCWQPADAPLFKAAIDASKEHLLPWMPWAANEPEPVEKKIALLRGFRGRFALDQDYVYGLLNRDESQVLGGSGLHTRAGEPARGAAALEIGYWIHVDHINRGLATETSAALTKVAFEVSGVERVEIHNDPQNVRSAAVPRKLGFVHEATLRQRARTADGEPRDTMVWTMLRDEYDGSPAALAEIEAFDVVGNKLL
jgi:RimJ/RimL family protein N-acetyltransferase